jgi:hypothetical protein
MRALVRRWFGLRCLFHCCSFHPLPVQEWQQWGDPVVHYDHIAECNVGCGRKIFIGFSQIDFPCTPEA